MKILIICSKESREVVDGIAELRRTIGAENVVDISYGAPHPNHVDFTNKDTAEVQKLLKTHPLVQGSEYDLLIVTGSHGDARLIGNTSFTRTKFNGLSDEGAGSLISHLKTKDIKFGHVILAACFSANYQNDFIPLLKNPKESSITSWTGICPNNFMAETIEYSKGNPIDITDSFRAQFEKAIEILTRNRAAKGMHEALPTEFTDDVQFTDEEMAFLNDFESSDITKKNADLGALNKTLNASAFTPSRSYELSSNILVQINRLQNFQEYKNSIAMAGENKALLESKINSALQSLNKIYATFISAPGISDLVAAQMKTTKNSAQAIAQVINKIGKTKGADSVEHKALDALNAAVGNYNTSTSLIELQAALKTCQPTLIKDRNDMIDKFLTAQYARIATARSTVILSSIDTGLAVYKEGVTHVRSRAPRSLSSLVNDHSDLNNHEAQREFPEQLTMLPLQLAAMGRGGVRIEENTTSQLNALVRTIAPAEGTPVLEGKEEKKGSSDELFDVPKVSGEQLATEQKQTAPGRYGMFPSPVPAETGAPKKDKQVKTDEPPPTITAT